MSYPHKILSRERKSFLTGTWSFSFQEQTVTIWHDILRHWQFQMMWIQLKNLHLNDLMNYANGFSYLCLIKVYFCKFLLQLHLWKTIRLLHYSEWNYGNRPRTSQRHGTKEKSATCLKRETDIALIFITAPILCEVWRTYYTGSIMPKIRFSGDFK